MLSSNNEDDDLNSACDGMINNETKVENVLAKGDMNVTAPWIRNDKTIMDCNACNANDIAEEVLD